MKEITRKCHREYFWTLEGGGGHGFDSLGSWASHTQTHTGAIGLSESVKDEISLCVK